MKKIAVYFFALAIAFANIGISSVFAAGAATLSLSPTNTSVKTGDSFSLSVTVNPSGESIDTARVNLSWDASKLEALAFDLGSLFPNLSPSNSTSNTSGTLSYGAFKFGTPVTASGTLATVTFRALKSGTTMISVSSDSKLISDGSEKLNVSSLGKATITVTGSAVGSEAPATSGDTAPAATLATPAVPATPATPAKPAEPNTEAAALKYFGALAGHQPASADEWAALKCMVNDGCKVTPPDVEKEKKALALYTKKYNGLPKTSMEWNVIHAIAYTNVFIKWPAPATPAVPATPATPAVPAVTPAVPAVPAVPATPATPAKLVEPNSEAAALKYYGALAGKLPKTSDEWAALKCMVNDGCKAAKQDADKEKKALAFYTKKYKGLPKTSMEWNVIHAIAYTNVFIKWPAPATPAVPATPATPATPAPAATPAAPATPATPATLTLEQQAVGWFGKLTGKLPATSADWLAVKYMVNGYKPAKQDLDAESDAVTLFSKKFGRLPSSSQDWNIVAAIAYSGAF